MSTTKALVPDIRFIDIGTKVYSIAQRRRAIQRALIGFESGYIAITRLPIPMNSNMIESTIPITSPSIPISSGK